MSTYLKSKFSHYYAQGARAIRDIWFDRKDLLFKKPSPATLIAAAAWTLEWALLIEHTFSEWTRANVLQAVRVPTLMAACLLYWFWLWGMAVWRRTQYGKFTRGERKLWAKALTAFWVAELVTALSFVLIYAWLSWGPAPLVYRTFAVSRKGIILEFIVFSYALFLAYTAKMLLKWNSWRTQLTLCCAIMCILSYVFWKDIMLLVMRENLYLPATARWRNVRTNLVVYTLTHDWWAQHATTHRAAYSLYGNLQNALITGQKPDLATIPILSQYNTNNTILSIHKEPRVKATFPILHHVVDYAAQYNPLTKYVQPTAAYPRRTGFIPKRLAMWQLLMILKMYHHLILLIWWALYAYRLIFRRRTAYTFLSSCAFNLYCCLVLAGLVYAIYIFPRAELFIKFKPQHLTLHRLLLQIHSGWLYLGRTALYWNQSTATPHFPLL